MHSFPLELLTVWWSLSILAEFRSLLNITTKHIISSHIVSLRIRLNLNLPSRTKQESSFSTQRSQSSCLLMENGIAHTPHLPPCPRIPNAPRSQKRFKGKNASVVCSAQLDSTACILPEPICTFGTEFALVRICRVFYSLFVLCWGSFHCGRV